MQPSLWTPLDRPGHKGIRDRLQRRGRLAQSIQLTPEQVREILLSIDDNEDYDGIKWTKEVLSSYVPDIFETATVRKACATWALEEAINLNFLHHIPS